MVDKSLLLFLSILVFGVNWISICLLWDSSEKEHNYSYIDLWYYKWRPVVVLFTVFTLVCLSVMIGYLWHKSL